jgi:hypothetical protein
MKKFKKTITVKKINEPWRQLLWKKQKKSKKILTKRDVLKTLIKKLKKTNFIKKESENEE